MPKVFLYMQISYDGYLATKDNNLSWTTNAEMPNDAALMESWGAAIIGYGGYTEMAAYWPRASEDASLSTSERKFAARYNAMKKYVFSAESHDLTWNNSELVRIADDAAIIAAVEKIIHSSNSDVVVYGGVQIAQTFARLDLIDEYMLVTHPIILGEGRPLFAAKTPPRALTLIDVAQNESGAMRGWYSRVKAERNKQNTL